MKMPSTIPA